MNNISDFPDRAIIEEEAGAWIIMLDSETEPSEQQRQAFKEWMSRSPAHREEVKNLAKFWGKMNILTELAVPQHIVPHNRKSRRQKQSSPFISNIAIAAYSLSLAVGIALWVQLAPSNSPQNGLYATAVGQQKTIQLRDGSTLQLNTNSQVRVDYTDQHRDIRLLQGEAHFVVAKNPNKPFRVAAGHGLVQAIGTAFAVYLNGDQLNVTVTEGQVGLQSLRPTYKINPAKSAAAQPIKSAAAPEVASAAAQPTKSAAAPEITSAAAPEIASAAAPGTAKQQSLGQLNAGQSITITNLLADSSAAQAIETAIEEISPQELERRLSWRKGYITFSGAPLDQVVAEIGRYSLISIELTDPTMASIKIGGQFRVGETDAILESLEKNFGLHVKRIAYNHVQLLYAAK